MSDGSLNEICRSNGCACGYTDVDNAYYGFLNDFFGKSVFENFKQKHMDDYLCICRDFEQKKRKVEPKSASKVSIRVPDSLNELFEKQDEQNMAASLKSRGKWSERVKLVSDRMRLEAHIMKRFFADVLQKIRDHLQSFFSGDSLKNVNIIMMVGGFSESKMLQEMGVHREEKRKTVGNEDLCVDIFHIHVHKGQSVKLNAEQIKMEFRPHMPGKKNISFDFYSSNECNPMYVTDEGCSKLGKITVDVLDDSRMENAVEVSFKFGGTEIQVEARDKKSGKNTKTKIDFI
ncbi:hypothetical protein CHS0354_040509 [Potamilus streckersoni]|uniref:Uncharacterized protein n=1 Tax=Potamilus streckersoni TaxID=2493646 RepID=A0AAE0WEM0_9BIVA|nr:hypothetical protein CHS0354_040509 [Potamilus streckersoni]